MTKFFQKCDNIVVAEAEADEIKVKGMDYLLLSAKISLIYYRN